MQTTSTIAKKLNKVLSSVRVQIDRQGYDRHGRYYGVGAPVFRVEFETPDYRVVCTDVRGENRAAVKNMIETSHVWAIVSKWGAVI